MTDVYIGGVPFLALGHRDGRFVRASGLFAFARRERGGGFTVLHFEMAEAINRVARPGHPRWDWCAGEGMDALLVHLAGRAAVVRAGVEVIGVTPLEPSPPRSGYGIHTTCLHPCRAGKASEHPVPTEPTPVRGEGRVRGPLRVEKL